MLSARFDGGCWPNPNGHAACACVIRGLDGKELHREVKYLGFGDGMTNNVAEFSGLLLILRWYNDFVKDNGFEQIHITGDSQIVINRLTKWRSKPSGGACHQASIDCLEASAWHRQWIRFEWRGRDFNQECDELCTWEIERQHQRIADPTWFPSVMIGEGKHE